MTKEEIVKIQTYVITKSNLEWDLMRLNGENCELRSKCDHTFSNGSSALFMAQDPQDSYGPQPHCKICGRWFKEK